MTTLKEQDNLVEEQKTKLETVPEDVKKLVTIANKLKTIETVSSLEEDEIEFISKYSSEEDLRNIFEDLLVFTKGFSKKYTETTREIISCRKQLDANKFVFLNKDELISKKDELITELKKSLKQSDKLNMYLLCVIGLMFISLIVVLFLN